MDKKSELTNNRPFLLPHDLEPYLKIFSQQLSEQGYTPLSISWIYRLHIAFWFLAMEKRNTLSRHRQQHCFTFCKAPLLLSRRKKKT